MCPWPPAHTWGAFEVRSISTLEVTDNGDGTETSQQTITVTLWQPGTYTTPPLDLSITDTTGQLTALSVAPVTLTVLSVLVEGDNELRDIKPQAVLPIPLWWPWLLAGLLLLAGIGWLGWRWYQTRLGQGEEIPTEPPDLRPAYQIALDELVHIQKLNLPAQQQFKTHYTLVTDVLRRYLEAAYHIPCLDRTTPEVRRALQRAAMPSPEKAAFLTLLSEADFVKFAQAEPSLETADLLPERARQFVLATKPTPDTAYGVNNQ